MSMLSGVRVLCHVYCPKLRSHFSIHFYYFGKFIFVIIWDLNRTNAHDYRLHSFLRILTQQGFVDPIH